MTSREQALEAEVARWKGELENALSSAEVAVNQSLSMQQEVDAMQARLDASVPKAELEKALLAAEETLEQQLALQSELDTVIAQRDKALASEAALKADLGTALLSAEESLGQQMALQSELEQLQAQRDALRLQVASQRRDWESAKSFAQERSKELAALEAELGRTKAELARAKADKKSDVDSKAALELANAQIVALRDEVQQALQTADEAVQRAIVKETELVAARETAAAQSLELEALRAKDVAAAELEARLSAAHQAEAALREELERTLKLAEQGMEESATLAAQLDAARMERDAIMAQLASAKTSNDAASARLAQEHATQLRSVQVALEAAEARCQSALQAESALRAELERTLQAAEHGLEQTSALAVELETTQAERDRYQKQLLETGATDVIVAKLQDKRATLRADCDAAVVMTQDAMAQLADAQRERDAMQQVAGAARAEADAAKSDAAALRVQLEGDLRSAEQSLDQLTALAADLETAQRERDSLRVELERARRVPDAGAEMAQRMQALQLERDSLQRKCDEVQQELGSERELWTAQLEVLKDSMNAALDKNSSFKSDVERVSPLLSAQAEENASLLQQLQIARSELQNALQCAEEGEQETLALQHKLDQVAAERDAARVEARSTRTTPRDLDDSLRRERDELAREAEALAQHNERLASELLKSEKLRSALLSDLERANTMSLGALNVMVDSQDAKALAHENDELRAMLQGLHVAAEEATSEAEKLLTQLEARDAELASVASTLDAIEKRARPEVARAVRVRQVVLGLSGDDGATVAFDSVASLHDTDACAQLVLDAIHRASVERGSWAADVAQLATRGCFAQPASAQRFQCNVVYWSEQLESCSLLVRLWSAGDDEMSRRRLGWTLWARSRLCALLGCVAATSVAVDAARAKQLVSQLCIGTVDAADCDAPVDVHALARQMGDGLAGGALSVRPRATVAAVEVAQAMVAPAQPSTVEIAPALPAPRRVSHVVPVAQARDSVHRSSTRRDSLRRDSMRQSLSAQQEAQLVQSNVESLPRRSLAALELELSHVGDAATPSPPVVVVDDADVELALSLVLPGATSDDSAAHGNGLLIAGAQWHFACTYVSRLLDGQPEDAQLRRDVTAFVCERLLKLLRQLSWASVGMLDTLSMPLYAGPSDHVRAVDAREAADHMRAWLAGARSLLT